jgi:hypothetical protein
MARSAVERETPVLRAEQALPVVPALPVLVVPLEAMVVPQQCAPEEGPQTQRLAAVAAQQTRLRPGGAVR